MEKKYRALRTIAVIYQVLGVIGLVITIITVIGICGFSFLGGAAMDSAVREYGGNSGGSGIVSGVTVGVIGSILTLLYGGIVSITLLAIGEGISLLIALEENTRKTVNLLELPKP